MSDLKYWLALNSLPDVGPVLARKLLTVFGNPENIFRLSVDELKRVENIGENRARSIVGFKQWDMIQREIDGAMTIDAKLITIKDKAYPQALRNLHDAPPVLYVKGEIKDCDRYALAIVGSRASTSYGIRVAEKLSYEIAAYGLTIISGLARGIDAASHKGALRAGGRTVAVLGSGIDVPYPPENRGLMDAITSSGAVISEFPLGTKPFKENFPRRNRIISSLSLGILVVEAAVDSGSLITVGYALEQGKEIFAVPGNIISKNSKGTNDLIKKGAKLVESAEEVIDELRPQIKGILREEKIMSGKPRPEISGEEAVLYKYLSHDPVHIDEIVRGTKIPSGKALSILLNLELKGIISQTEGKLFYLNY